MGHKRPLEANLAQHQNYVKQMRVHLNRNVYLKSEILFWIKTLIKLLLLLGSKVDLDHKIQINNPTITHFR